jgi:ABC-type Fe3+/spermidine/putrescine transport system ATPase subunit
MYSAASDPHLQIDSLGVRLGTFQLRDITLSCSRGEYHILMGPTGSGKSSLIKSLLGLVPIRDGGVRLHGRNITRDPPERRRMGYVPQNYALFPHLNVEENLGFAFKARNISRREADSTVAELCTLLGIEQLLKRRVDSLSGGERQKVALGRALAAQPEIILLDEPFSSIDEGARRALWFELKRIIREVGVTALHITHNLEEAYALGERLSILINGELVQSGSKQEVFERPFSEDVARYLNYRNIFSGVAERHPAGTSIGLGHFHVIVDRDIGEGQQVRLCVRQQDIKIIREGSPLKHSLRRNILPGKIVSLLPLPESCLMWFKIDGSPNTYDLELKFPAYVRVRHNLSQGQSIRVALWEPNIIVF